MMHSSTRPASMPARRTASATTRAPSSGAVKSLSAPRNFPVGVRTALTMTTSRTRHSLRDDPHLEALDGCLAEEIPQTAQDDGGGAPHLGRPLQARSLHD